MEQVAVQDLKGAEPKVDGKGDRNPMAAHEDNHRPGHQTACKLDGGRMDNPEPM